MGRKPYPGDLTDAQWRPIAPPIPGVKPGGRPRKYDMREVVNGLLYLAREGCSWRALPHDLPHWKACYHFFRRFEADVRGRRGLCRVGRGDDRVRHPGGAAAVAPARHGPTSGSIAGR